MSSNESAAYEIMRSLDVDYVLIIFGGVIGYSGDDINKFLWMVRIAEGEHPKDIRVSGTSTFCFFKKPFIYVITFLGGVTTVEANIYYLIVILFETCAGIVFLE